MQQLQVPFAGGEFEARASNVNAQRTINLYPEVTQAGAKQKIVLYGTPGLNRQTAAGVGPIRSNGSEFKGKLYFVSKDELYSVDSTNTATAVGTLQTETGRCTLAAGRGALLVVDGASGYVWDGATFLDLATFARQGTNQITNPTFSADSDWTKGTGWTISGGTASCDGTQTATSDLSQTINPAGDYIVYFELSGVSAGGVTASVGGGLGTQRTANGAYIERITASSGTDFALQADADFVGSVDNVTVYEAGVFPQGATHVTYLDGFFIANAADSDQWFISQNENPTIWGALDFATAANQPDDILAHDAYDGDLYMVGERTVEIYDNTGNADFPFERYPNGILDYGIEAPYSMARGRSGLFWLGRTEEGGIQVLQAAGLTVKPVSNPSLEYQIEQLSKTDDAIGWVYAQGGHTFYWLTFPAEGLSLVLDVGNGLWHERQYGAAGRHRANGHGFLSGKHYVGDYESGMVYTLDLDQYTDDGEAIHRIRRAPVVHKDRKRLFVHSIEVEFEAGVGLTTGQGSDPQAMLRISKDGGHTWTDELWRDIGQRGEYNARAVWRKMGNMRSFIVEMRVSDPIPVTMLAAYAQVDVADT